MQRRYLVLGRVAIGNGWQGISHSAETRLLMGYQDTVTWWKLGSNQFSTPVAMVQIAMVQLSEIKGIGKMEIL